VALNLRSSLLPSLVVCRVFPDVTTSAHVYLKEQNKMKVPLSYTSSLFTTAILAGQIVLAADELGVESGSAEKRIPPTILLETGLMTFYGNAKAKQ
jgi:hypothetical protein